VITVTERAKEELKRVWSANVGAPEVGFRLTPVAVGEYHLVPDREREGDHVVEHEGAKILLVDEKLTGILEGVTVDYCETDAGPRLAICE